MLPELYSFQADEANSNPLWDTSTLHLSIKLDYQEQHKSV